MRLSHVALLFAATAVSRVALAEPPPAASSPTTQPAAKAPVEPGTDPATEPTSAAAAAQPAITSASEEPPPDEKALARLYRPPGPTFHILGTLFFGDGFRFNNPYRLQTQLGESAKTVSLTAPYVDLGIACAIGDAFGLQHGLSLNLSASLGGLSQTVLAPTYLAAYRGSSTRFFGFARLGPAIILSPDANVGFELGAGAAALVSAKVGVTAEVVGDLFYGAATREVGYPVYPVVSLQLGLLLDHEVLP